MNKQNYRFWGLENPEISQEKTLHTGKVTVWAAITIKEIYGRTRLPQMFNHPRN